MLKWHVWSTVLFLLGQLGRLRTFRGGLILCLHHIKNVTSHSFRPTAELAMTPQFLDCLLKFLRDRNIDVISLREGLERLKRGNEMPFVCLTFDDGYRDNFDIAFPIFERHRAPFAIFLTTGFLDRTWSMWWEILENIISNSDQVEFPDNQGFLTRTVRQKYQAYVAGANWFRDAAPSAAAVAIDRLRDRYPQWVARPEVASTALSWDMVREMADSGLVTLGAHTISHSTLSRLDPETIAYEIVSSRDRITDELGIPPAYFAYPYGSATDIGGAATGLVAKHGFEAGFTTIGRPIESHHLSQPFVLPRMSWDGRQQRLSVFHAHSSGLSFAFRDMMMKIGSNKAHRST